MIHLAALRCCECQAAELFAIAPGTEPEGMAPDLFTPLAANADVGAPVVTRCWRCWAARYASARMPHRARWA